MGFGEDLRSAREERGIALDDIAVATRVPVRNLSALEAERFRELPGGVFNRGIIRSYARYVGLDEDETISSYMQALRSQGVNPEQENANWAEFAENVKRSRAPRVSARGMRWAGVAGMMLAVLLLAAAVTGYLAMRGVIHLPARLQRHLVHTGAERQTGQPGSGATAQ